MMVKLHIYDKVHAHGPPGMGRRFWGHLPLSWMHQKMLGAKLYYTLFDNEEARNDEDRLWVLVLRDARRCSAATATSMDVIAVATAYLESATFYTGWVLASVLLAEVQETVMSFE